MNVEPACVWKKEGKDTFNQFCDNTIWYSVDLGRDAIYNEGIFRKHTFQ